MKPADFRIWHLADSNLANTKVRFRVEMQTSMSALPIDYISARGSRMVISPVGSRNKLELKLRQVRALQRLVT
jgi:hypothetical protein